jgi:hypothetical protein
VCSRHSKGLVTSAHPHKLLLRRHRQQQRLLPALPTQRRAACMHLGHAWPGLLQEHVLQRSHCLLIAMT